MAEILKAKPVVKTIYSEIDEELKGSGRKPLLEIILAGNDPAAEWYVNNLIKQGSKRGIIVKVERLPSGIKSNELLGLIEKFNNSAGVSGIMLQKPLPGHLEEELISEAVSPTKDVDGFHPSNLGKMLLGQKALLPCTPQAVLKVLEYYKIDTCGKEVVIAGRSNIVGKPLANLLLRRGLTGDATVTVCHSKTRDLTEHCRRADILIAAIGKPAYIKAEMVKDNAIVIDVGTNQIKDENGQLKYTGDVDFAGVSSKVKAITPVPGGIGSITTSLLLKNVIDADKSLSEKKNY